MKIEYISTGRAIDYSPTDDFEEYNNERRALGKKVVKYKEYRRKIAVYLSRFNHYSVQISERCEIESIKRTYNKVLKKGLYIFKDAANGHIYDYVYVSLESIKLCKQAQSFNDRAIKSISKRSNSSYKLKAMNAAYYRRRDAWLEYINK